MILTLRGERRWASSGGERQAHGIQRAAAMSGKFDEHFRSPSRRWELSGRHKNPSRLKRQ